MNGIMCVGKSLGVAALTNCVQIKRSLDVGYTAIAVRDKDHLSDVRTLRGGSQGYVAFALVGDQDTSPAPLQDHVEIGPRVERVHGGHLGPAQGDGQHHGEIVHVIRTIHGYRVGLALNVEVVVERGGERGRQGVVLAKGPVQTGRAVNNGDFFIQMAAVRLPLGCQELVERRIGAVGKGRKGTRGIKPCQ